MKKFYVIILLILPSILSAQVVVTVPQFPTQNDSIIITLDATQPGAEELLNYTGTVYGIPGLIQILEIGSTLSETGELIQRSLL
jgi:hypothetical protein